MDPLDDLRIRYRRLRTRQLEAAALHRAQSAEALLRATQSVLVDQGFEVMLATGLLKAVKHARSVTLRADSDDDVRIGEFLGFTFVDSLEPSRRIRIIAQVKADALAENAPMDVNTAQSIQAQIAYMQRLLESGAPATLGFEVRQTMTMANYREPQSGHEPRVFASLRETIAHLLGQSDSDEPV